MSGHEESEKSAPDKPWMVAASVLALVVYFALTAHDGLNAYFTQDDGGNILNMHKYWDYSMAQVLGATARVVTGAYRPMGGLYYFALYKLAGFNPAPFRVVCLILMLGNVLLAFALLRRLSGSLEAALLGAFLITNHPAVLELLYSSGTIYELLCFLFYFLTLWFYFTWRRAGQARGQTTLSWRQLAAVVVLTGCALDSKEMAMTLPGALLLIELFYFPPNTWSWRAMGEFVIRQGRAAMLTAALVLPTIAIKVLTKNPLSDDSRYHSHSVHATLDAMRAYHHFFLYGFLSPDGFSTANLFALWGGMAVVAILFRSKSMGFGLCFLIGALMPVCLIAPRNGYMAYIPLMGWALYIGCLFQRLCGLLFGRGNTAPLLRFASLAAVAGLIANTHAAMLAPYENGYRQHQSESRRIIDRLRQVHPQLPAGSSLQLVDDPAETGYEILFLARLAYHDPTLELNRMKMLATAPSGRSLTRYDWILAGGWDLRDVRGLADMRPPVEVRFQPATVQAPEFAGQTVDLGTRTIVDNHAARTLTESQFTLDPSGSAPLPSPLHSPPATLRASWIRPRGGDWMSATGLLPSPR